MGRGRFINALSQAEPKQNFVAVEMRNEVIYDAGLKIGDDRKNVAVISARAEGLPQWFAPGEVERIYLNFSDPWPKRAHRKRRLTHENFLALYREILPPEGEILLRTDAVSLMEFSLVEMTNHGFSLAEVSFDLHNSPYFDGFTTEYEEKKSIFNGSMYFIFICYICFSLLYCQRRKPQLYRGRLPYLCQYSSGGADLKKSGHRHDCSCSFESNAAYVYIGNSRSGFRCFKHISCKSKGKIE